MPPDCTSFLQPIDVGIGRPFKQNMFEKFHAWVSESYMEIVSRKGKPKKTFKNPISTQIVKWVIESYNALQPLNLKNS